MRSMTEQEVQEAKMLEEWASQNKNMKMITPRMKKASETYKQDSENLESFGSFTVGKWESKKRKY